MKAGRNAVQTALLPAVNATPLAQYGTDSESDAASVVSMTRWRGYWRGRWPRGAAWRVHPPVLRAALPVSCGGIELTGKEEGVDTEPLQVDNPESKKDPVTTPTFFIASSDVGSSRGYRGLKTQPE